MSGRGPGRFTPAPAHFITHSLEGSPPGLLRPLGGCRIQPGGSPCPSQAIMAAAAEAPDLMAPVNRLLAGYVTQVLAETSDAPLALVILAALDGLRFQHLMRLPPADPAHRTATLERILAMIETLEPKA